MIDSLPRFLRKFTLLICKFETPLIEIIVEALAVLLMNEKLFMVRIVFPAFNESYETKNPD